MWFCRYPDEASGQSAYTFAWFLVEYNSGDMLKGCDSELCRWGVSFSLGVVQGCGSKRVVQRLRLTGREWWARRCLVMMKWGRGWATSMKQSKYALKFLCSFFKVWNWIDVIGLHEFAFVVFYFVGISLVIHSCRRYGVGGGDGGFRSSRISKTCTR